MTVNRPSFNANTYFECHKDRISSNYFFLNIWDNLDLSFIFLIYINKLYESTKSLLF